LPNICQCTLLAVFDKLLFLDHIVYPFNWFLPPVSLFNTILVIWGQGPSVTLYTAHSTKTSRIINSLMSPMKLLLFYDREVLVWVSWGKFLSSVCYQNSFDNVKPNFKQFFFLLLKMSKWKRIIVFLINWLNDKKKDS